MSDESRAQVPEDKHGVMLMGLLLSLRQTALDLVEANRAEEARGVVDTVEALEAKTRGNLTDDEQKVVMGVLYELRMAIVRGGSGEGEGGDAGGPGEPAPDEKPDAEPGAEPDEEAEDS